MGEFAYRRPQTLAECAALLREDGAKALAGGTDLVPQLREGRRQARTVVDLKRVQELTALERTSDGGWRIGGAVSVRALGANAAFAGEHAALLASARLIGSLQVQSRATLAGNLCNAAPSADGVPLLLALDATCDIAGQAGRRTLAAAEVATGPGRNALAPGELLEAIVLPPRPARTAARYLRFTPRREMDIAIAGSGVRVDLDGDGRIAKANIVLASVAPVPLRATRASACLLGERPSSTLFEDAATIAASEATPISDTRGSADYRRDLVAVLTRRALADCARELGVNLQ
ncbi:MAG: xanthine dehydrogenase family protein subunit M [Hyphomicrobiaceae bacterium]